MTRVEATLARTALILGAVETALDILGDGWKPPTDDATAWSIVNHAGAALAKLLDPDTLEDVMDIVLHSFRINAIYVLGDVIPLLANDDCGGLALEVIFAHSDGRLDIHDENTRSKINDYTNRLKPCREKLRAEIKRLSQLHTVANCRNMA